MTTDTTTTQGRFAGILENYCDTALLCPASKLQDDAGLDSLDCVEVLMDVEQEFSVEVPVEVEEEWAGDKGKTVADAVAWIDKSLAAKSGGAA